MRFALIFPFLSLVAVSPRAFADPLAELAAFSAFSTVDLGELAKAEAKTTRGPAMSSSRAISVQSCFVIPGAPSKVLEEMKKWNAMRHRELKIYAQGDLPASPSAANFSALRSAPDNAAVRAFVTATKKQSTALQISRDEAKRLPAADAAGDGVIPAPVAAFWSELLARRAQGFSSGGGPGQPAYDFARAVRPGDELGALLRQQDKLQRQFSGILGETNLLRGSGSLRPALSWGLIDADEDAAVTLGAFYSRAAPGGGFQAVDATYYASGGCNVSVTLFQLWPVQVGGREVTLVWRGDLVSAEALASLRGIERLGAESSMLKRVARTVSLFKRDIGP